MSRTDASPAAAPGLRSPEPDVEGMRARYDAAVYAHLEGRSLTPAQQRIVQFHFHGEGCRPCATMRGPAAEDA